jgi:hypothetical protein
MKTAGAIALAIAFVLAVGCEESRPTASEAYQELITKCTGRVSIEVTVSRFGNHTTTSRCEFVK